ncbi:TetR/AcrR family transcriptional regulator [Streptomyces sp. NBC_00193]|uniref:TetR/AcrR family transcriptional regulator n=1 Tax=unclassified Streptomyces TaxID=2593676 RepID=UPI0022566238|nr:MULTISPECIES: TetR/AcrR family transcriptional regulator [unclassified Streptomyces]MCX5129147.1 TetR/AcrR family transcriptional regulator [Streptomyces sp. NBC_00347]MCX5299687.1 TetR/AcrR family transcriptional regulator [Streptomyces sp. NBC_00193]
MNNSQQRGTTGRSQVRRAELIAIGRKLFADTSYDALSMDDIAKHAGVAKGLIYYYFKSKRGYYLAIVEDSVAELVARAAGESEQPTAQRVRTTIDGYLYYAEHHQAAYRTIVTGGVGSDSEVLAIRDAVREELIATIAEGAYGRREIPPLARLALVGWLAGVEGSTLDWIGPADAPAPVPADAEADADAAAGAPDHPNRPNHPNHPDRAEFGALLVRTLRATLTVIEEFVPECPAPPVPDEDLVPVTGSP